jgi:hypothetical protein
LARNLTADEFVELIPKLHRLAHAITHRVNNLAMPTDAKPPADGSLGEDVTTLWNRVNTLMTAWTV